MSSPAADATPPGCYVEFSADPLAPVIGDTVTVSARVERSTGRVVPRWTVRDPARTPVDGQVGLEPLGGEVGCLIDAVRHGASGAAMMPWPCAHEEGVP